MLPTRLNSILLVLLALTSLCTVSSRGLDAFMPRSKTMSNVQHMIYESSSVRDACGRDGRLASTDPLIFSRRSAAIDALMSVGVLVFVATSHLLHTTGSFGHRSSQPGFAGLVAVVLPLLLSSMPPLVSAQPPTTTPAPTASGVLVGVGLYSASSSCTSALVYQLFELGRCDNLHGTGSSLLVTSATSGFSFTLYSRYECDPASPTLTSFTSVSSSSCTGFLTISVQLFTPITTSTPLAVAGTWTQSSCSSPTTPSVTCASVFVSSYAMTQTGSSITWTPTSPIGTIYDNGLVALRTTTPGSYGSCYGWYNPPQLNLDCFTTANAQPRLEVVYTCASGTCVSGSTVPPPAPVAWAGTYAVQSGGCSTTSCCCLTGTVTVTQSGLSVTFSGPVVGQCGSSTSYSGSATLSSASSTTASFALLGQQFTATRSGNTVSVQNIAFPQCSGSATCTGGACLSTSAGGYSGPSFALLLVLLLAVLLDSLLTAAV